MPRSAQDQPIIRSVADIFAVLDRTDRGSSNQLVRFYAMSFTTPDGKQTGFVAVEVECQITGTRQPLKMPTCSGFLANSPDGTALPPFAIDRLDGAIAHPDGTLRLLGNERVASLLVKNARFRPASIDCEFSRLENAVIQYALQHIERTLGVKDLCYRELSPEYAPGIMCLDYGLVRTVRIPSMTKVVHYVEARLKDIVTSKPNSEMRTEYENWLAGKPMHVAIARTIRRAGMQSPRRLN